jgi:hypothetical protein
MNRWLDMRRVKGDKTDKSNSEKRLSCRLVDATFEDALSSYVSGLPREIEGVASH